jgi:hypothetical protein
MIGIGGFLAPFLDYFRPTKSPYLVVAFVSILVISLRLSNGGIDDLDRPDFFLPIYAILAVIVGLSLLLNLKPKTAAASDNGEKSQPTTGLELVNNAKYENDLDSVFKFSRALCLAAGAVMLYVYQMVPRVDSIYTTIVYWTIIIQMITFLAYMTFRQFRGEDLTNAGLFQVAFITAAFFVGSTHAGLMVTEKTNQIEFLYCKSSVVAYKSPVETKSFNGCNFDGPLVRVEKVSSYYRPNFKNISFVFLNFCWAVYELFWLSTLFRLATVRGSAAQSSHVSAP